MFGQPHVNILMIELSASAAWNPPNTTVLAVRLSQVVHMLQGNTVSKIDRERDEQESCEAPMSEDSGRWDFAKILSRDS